MRITTLLIIFLFLFSCTKEKIKTKETKSVVEAKISFKDEIKDTKPVVETKISVEDKRYLDMF